MAVVRTSRPQKYIKFGRFTLLFASYVTGTQNCLIPKLT